MAESAPSSAPTAEPTVDPTTIIGLIFRVLDRPSRTLCLLAILALTLAGIGELLHAPPIAHLPLSVWGTAISGASITPIGVKKLVRHPRRQNQNSTRPRPSSPEAAASKVVTQ